MKNHIKSLYVLITIISIILMVHIIYTFWVIGGFEIQKKQCNRDLGCLVTSSVITSHDTSIYVVLKSCGIFMDVEPQITSGIYLIKDIYSEYQEYIYCENYNSFRLFNCKRDKNSYNFNSGSFVIKI